MAPALTDRGWRVAAALVLLLLSAYLQFSVVLGTKVNDPIRADAEKYVSYAYNLRHAGVFSHRNTWERAPAGVPVVPDKLTLPGYPAFLALFLHDTPDERFLTRVTLAQAALGVGSTLLVYLIALQLLPLGGAFAAALLVAASPHMAVISTYLLTEALFTFLLLASVLAILFAWRPQARRWHWALAGVLLGLACLVRPQLQLLVVLGLGLAFIPKWRLQRTNMLLAVACFAALTLPWQVRNAGTHTPTGQPDLLVMTLYHGSFPNMMYRDDPATYGNPYFYDPDQARATRDLKSVLGRIGAGFASNPQRYASWYLFGKPGFFLSWGMLDAVGGIFIYPAERSPFLEKPLFKWLRSLNFVIHWPLMLLGVAGALVALWKPRSLVADRQRQVAGVILATIFLYAIGLHMIGTPLSRYAIPFRPLAYVLAVVMARAAWQRLRQRPSRRAAGPGVPA